VVGAGPRIIPSPVPRSSPGAFPQAFQNKMVTMRHVVRALSLALLWFSAPAAAQEAGRTQVVGDLQVTLPPGFPRLVAVDPADGSTLHGSTWYLSRRDGQEVDVVRVPLPGDVSVLPADLDAFVDTVLLAKTRSLAEEGFRVLRSVRDGAGAEILAADTAGAYVWKVILPGAGEPRLYTRVWISSRRAPDDPEFQAMTRALRVRLAPGAVPLAPPPGGRLPHGCRVQPPPGRGAARDTLRDRIRAELAEEVRGAARAAGVAQPLGLVLVRAARADDSLRVYTTGVNLPHATVVAALERRRARLAEWPDTTGRGPLVDLRLDGPVREDARSGSVECSPAPLNPDFLAARLGRLAELARREPHYRRPTSVRDVVIGRREETLLGLLLGRDGVVEYAAIMRSSDDTAQDSAALAIARELRFRPASVDGVAIDFWVLVPVRY
jgi:TonB family protein